MRVVIPAVDGVDGRQTFAGGRRADAAHDAAACRAAGIGTRACGLERQGADAPHGTALAPDRAMTTRISHRCMLPVLLLCALATAASAAEQDPQTIRAAAESAVRARAAVSGRVYLRAATLDPRLRLPLCSQALDAVPAGDGALRAEVPISVRCAGERPWSLYLVVHVESDVPVLVARRALPRDAVPAAADFTLATRRVAGLASQYVGDVAALAGRRLRRPVGAGEPLGIDALAIAPVIHRGEQVTLLARSAAVEIRVPAIALADGRPEERIRVQNAASQRVIEGVVRAAGLVEVPL
jgi:flagella basal body P-ring formation protein FlgA